MSSVLESLAAVVQDPELALQAEIPMDRLRLHIADTLGNDPPGSVTRRRQNSSGSRFSFGRVVRVRLTEADDTHLTSCTTPGSVVVPTALHLAAAGFFQTWGDFVTAVLVGYETLIRIGYSIDGARILARKIWPTLFAAPVGAAAVASLACGLNRSQTVGALATALAASKGIAPPAITSNSSRCISLGFAAEHGVRAAMAARAGALGDVQLIERHAGRIAGMRISRHGLLQGAGLHFLLR